MTKKETLNKLKELNIEYDITKHGPVYTIEEMNALNMENSDFIIKNLFIRDEKKQNYYLVLVEKDKKMNLKELRKTIASKPLTFANEEDLYKYLKLTKGAVSPLGILNDKDHFVKVLIDKSLLDYKVLGVHPCDNTATVWINPQILIKMIENNQNEIIYFDIKVDE